MSEDKDQQFVALLNGIPVLQAFEIAKYIDQKLKEPNDFIKDIAKLLGEDGLGFDGLSWTADDFKEAIDQEKRSTAIAYNKWGNANAYWMPPKERWYLHGPEDWIPGGRTDEELYDYYLSLPK